MQLVLKHQAVLHKNNDACTVSAYPLNDPMMDMATATITGRYPSEKRVVNRECAELVYVYKGEGKLVLNNEEYKLSAGDAALIEAGEKYYFEGHMKMFISCRPAWHPEQHHSVD